MSDVSTMAPRTLSMGADLEYFQEPNQDSYCGKRAREALAQSEKERV